MFSWHTLGPLIPTEHCVNATAYLSIAADHMHQFMATVDLDLIMATFSTLMYHVTKSSPTGSMNMRTTLVCFNES